MADVPAWASLTSKDVKKVIFSIFSICKFWKCKIFKRLDCILHPNSPHSIVSSSGKYCASDMNDMESYVAKESVIKDEIIWVQKNVMSGFSWRSCDGIVTVLKRCFLIIRLLISFHLPEQNVLTWWYMVLPFILLHC